MANSELRELLDRAARKLDLPFDNQEPIDITERFFEDCSHLALGEVVRYDSFTLGEAMSAVELMDEKMDIGMKKVTRKMGLEESIAKGLYESSLGEQLIIYDATLCTFVTWLEGSCIGQTLWTNVLLTDPERVRFEDHPVFACLSHGFYHIVMLVKSIIQNASVYEEEDFNPHLPFPCTSHYPMHEVIQLMKDIELDLVRRSEETDKDEEKTKLLTLSSRIAFMRIFLVTLTFLVPPRKPEEWRTDSSQMPPLDALGFTADLDAATSAASKLILLSSKFLDTSVHECASRPNGIERDGDFSWLIAFEPELNRQYLPSTFPRKIEILPREKALPHLHRISCKIHFMASQLRNNLADSNSLVEFMKWFSYDDSCVLTRSILQMVIYPLDDNVLGTQPTALFVERSLKNTVLPLALMPHTPLYDNEDCRKVVEDFTMNATRVMLSLYQNFGFNLARQRDKLVIILEEFNELHEDACRADAVCRDIVPVHNKYNPFVTFVFTQTLSLVVYHMELSFRLELFAPFEFTYIYWFYGEVVGRWYMTSIEKTRELMRDTLRKESELHEQGRKNKKKVKPRLHYEEHFRNRSAVWQDQLILRYGHSAMADATFHIAVALIQMGQIRVPVWNEESERLRFEHRMAFLISIGDPLHVTYEEFLSRSRVRELLDGDISVPLQRAIDTFELARSQFEKLVDRNEFTIHIKPLILVCRTNVVVARLLLAGNVRDRRVTFNFMPDSPIFPILKLVAEK
uniref:Protein MAK10 homolog n=1 Tax=Haemonchus contortus TaxID=6289 RepID=A0A7I4YZ20_HAECO